MSILSNPTRTQKIESAWLRDINRRWARFTNSVVAELRKMDKAARAQNQSGLSVNVTEPFDMSASQILIYMLFMQAQIDEIITAAQVSAIGGDINWQARYQIQSYEKSIGMSRAALRAQGASLIPTAAERAAALGVIPFDIAPSLATGATGAFPPIHSDALEFLFTRSFDKLKGWTDSMASETRQVLFDGANQGQGINEIVRNMRKRIDVSKSRAELIARTEIIQAFQISQTNEAERAAEELGEPVLLRWLTSRDGRVRHLHASWHGTLSTPKENAVRITKSPWRCRCSQSPVIEEANTPEKKEKFDLQRKQLLAIESAQSRKRRA